MTRGPSTTPKCAFNVVVEYYPPKLSEHVINTVMRYQAEVDDEQNVAARTNREGQAWVGETAAVFAAERSAEIDKEQATPSEKERHGRSRESHRRTRTLSVSTSHSGENGQQLPTPTDSAHSVSPSFKYLPLTATGHEETRASILPAVAEGPEQRRSNGIDHFGARRRAPSESATKTHSQAAPRRRTHSSSHSSSSGNKEKGERHETFANRGGASGNMRGSARQRGSTSTRATKKHELGVEVESAFAQEGQSSRRGRGYSRGSGRAASNGTGSKRRTAS